MKRFLAITLLTIFSVLTLATTSMGASLSELTFNMTNSSFYRDEVTLCWNSIPNATEYVVKIYDKTANLEVLKNDSVNDTSFSVHPSRLIAGHAYTATVSANVNNEDQSGKFDFEVLQGYKVSGYIQPENYGTSNEKQLTKSGFIIKVAGTDLTTVSNENGYFYIRGVRPGTCRVEVSGQGYLKRIIQIEALNEDTLVASQKQPMELWPGDFNNDGAINMTDVMKLAASFNTSSKDARYKKGFDLNGDNAVNMNDIMVLVKHYNQGSKDYPSLSPVETTEYDGISFAVFPDAVSGKLRVVGKTSHPDTAIWLSSSNVIPLCSEAGPFDREISLTETGQFNTIMITYKVGEPRYMRLPNDLLVPFYSYETAPFNSLSSMVACEPYTGSSAKVQSDDSEIIDLANLITEGCDTDRERAQAIFLWVQNNIGYDEQEYQDDYASKILEDHCGALVTLKTRKGIGRDFAYLVAALGRALGLKVQVVNGEVSQPVQISSSWNLIWLSEENAWINVDATGSTWFDFADYDASHYKDFITGEKY